VCPVENQINNKVIDLMKFASIVAYIDSIADDFCKGYELEMKRKNFLLCLFSVNTKTS